MTGLSFDTAGTRGAPAIMLLHGFMSSNGQWLLNREALARRYFLVMVELWGHGASPTPRQKERYTVDAYVAEFERIREQLGIARWSLIGQSYGAGLVLQYARRRPQVCEAVVVTNSRSAFGSAEAEERKDNGPRNRLSEPDFDPRKLPFHPIHARRFPQFVKDELVAAADAMSVDAIRLGGRLGGRLNAIDYLGELRQPLLLTNGEYEKAFQTDLARLLTRYPQLEVAHLPGGHSVNIEAAEEFNAVVQAFLERVHGADGAT